MSRVEQILLEGVATSDAMLISHVVMPNHFHLTIRQSARPLGWIMMPIMRRIAIAVQNRYGIQGHVFGERFYSEPSHGPDHLRNTVVYTHLNPTRAKLCNGPADYRWSSHSRFVVDDVGGCSTQLLHILRLFGNRPNESHTELRQNYLRFMDWRIRKDAHKDPDIPFAEPEPATVAGDNFYAENFCALWRQSRPQVRDLRDKALDLLEQIDDGVNINELRRRHLPRRLSEVRDQLIAGLLQAGYRGKRIADFLRISDSKVSQIAIKMRYANVPT